MEFLVIFVVIGILFLIFALVKTKRTETYYIVLGNEDINKNYIFMDEEFYIPSKTVVGDDIYSINQKTSDKIILHIVAIINTKTLKEEILSIKEILSSDCYITHSMLENQLSLNRNNLAVIQNIFKNQADYKYLSDETRGVIVDFCNCMKNAEDIRIEMNEEYVKKGLKKYQTFFDTIEKYPLEQKQRLAILHDEDNNLVVAGAGTGKTTTIISKIVHLVQNIGIDPASILVLSYSKKAVEELKERLKKYTIESVNIKTFHALGNSIIKSGKTVLDPENNEKEEIIKEIFNNDILKNTTLLKKITEFFAYYLKDIQTNDDFFGNDDIKGLPAKDKLKKYFKYLKSNRGHFITLDGKVVKSPDELRIANFLCLHNIKYKYEAVYKDRQSKKTYSRGYQPDFYLEDYDIYLEHFSLNKDMGSSYYGENYVNKYYDKVNRHNLNKTKLIESYSFEFRNKAPQEIDSIIEGKLRSNGIRIGEIDYESVVKNLISNNQEYKLFIPLVSTFIGLFKSNNISLQTLKKTYLDDRNQAFLEIFEMIYKEYQSKLNENKKIDFDDMIGSAVQAIENGKYKSNFKYILVDEFQDISHGRYQLLKKLRDLNTGCKLFCVGDDWQSIYRFAGSDISIFTQFTKDIGYTKETQLEYCRRLPKNINTISSNFILENPSQLKKALICNKDTVNLNILYFNPQEIPGTIRKFKDNHKEESTLILARYNFQLDQIEKSKNIDIMSIHKAKGLEADNVVLILNNSNYPYIFPSEISSDQVLDMVLSVEQEIEYAEERRLFYVALTRTKKNLYILVDKNSTNIFVDELKIMTDMNIKTYGEEIEGDGMNHGFCRKCGGNLIPRQNKNTGEIFNGCEYFPYCE